MMPIEVFSFRLFSWQATDWAIFILLIGCTISAIGCSGDGISGTFVELDEVILGFPEDTGTIDVFFCPYQDCSSRLTRLIEEAVLVDCAFFDLDIPEVISALEKRHARVVVDNINSARLEKEMEDHSLQLSFLRYDDGNRLSHNKFCVFDNEIVLTGSMNPTYNGVGRNDNNVVVISSKLVAGIFQEEFEELWAGQFGKGKKNSVPVMILNGERFESYFCPEDCRFGGGEGRIVDLIDGAEDTIEIAMFTFTLDSVADALIRAKERGVRVTVIIENRQRNVLGSVYSRLLDEGLDIRLDKNPGSMHHKFMIIDRKIVWTGSYNFSRNANDRNDENIIIFHDQEIAGIFAAEFQRVASYE